jgi:hypothetical protein
MIILPRLHDGKTGSGLTQSRAVGVAGGTEPVERDADPEDEEVDAIHRGI